jgi:hypothetical protein
VFLKYAEGNTFLEDGSENTVQQRIQCLNSTLPDIFCNHKSEVAAQFKYLCGFSVSIATKVEYLIANRKTLSTPVLHVQPNQRHAISFRK